MSTEDPRIDAYIAKSADFAKPILNHLRKLVHAQVEQLRAGRERLLDAYRLVRRTLDEVTEELHAAEGEARAAAEAAGRRIATESDLTMEELEAAAAAEPEPEIVDVGPGPEVAEVAELAELAAVAEIVDGPVEEAPISVAPEPAPPPERRSSSLRILRRARHEPPESVRPLTPVEERVAREAVRVLPAEPVPDEPPEAELPDVGPVPEVGITDRPDIDELFARIRADREEAVARAEAVLAEPGAQPGAQPIAEPSETEDAGATTEGEAEVAPEPEAQPAAADQPVGNAEEAALQRRDELLEPVDTALVRRLKRVVQDDQNSVLDALRTARGRPSASDVLPELADHVGRYRDVAASLLAQAAEAGSLFSSGGIRAAAAVDDIADDLAHELVAPLRDRLARAVEESGHDDAGEEEDAALRDSGDVVDRVNAAYREWKLQRVEPLSRHAVARAFGRAGFAATADGTQLRWVVDDEGGPCPDCDDDVLAGGLPKGEPFPTGQLHPPAHVGCRCLLVRAVT